MVLEIVSIKRAGDVLVAHQIIGPQVVANPKMKKAAITIKAVAADSVLCGLFRSREK